MPHPSTAAERLLELMNAISEDDYAAGWRIDLEYMLWRRVLSKRADERTQSLRGLSSEAGGWWVFDDIEGRTFMPLPEWVAMFNADPRRGIEVDDDTLPAAPAPSTPADTGIVGRLAWLADDLDYALDVDRRVILTDAADRIVTLERQLAESRESNGIACEGMTDALLKAREANDRANEAWDEVWVLRERLATLELQLGAAGEVVRRREAEVVEMRERMETDRYAARLRDYFKSQRSGTSLASAAFDGGAAGYPGGFLRAGVLDGHTLVDVGERVGDLVWVNRYPDKDRDHEAVDPARVTLLVDATPEMLAAVEQQQARDQIRADVAIVAGATNRIGSLRNYGPAVARGEAMLEVLREAQRQHAAAPSQATAERCRAIWRTLTPAEQAAAKLVQPRDIPEGVEWDHEAGPKNSKDEAP